MLDNSNKFLIMDKEAVNRLDIIFTKLLPDPKTFWSPIESIVKGYKI